MLNETIQKRIGMVNENEKILIHNFKKLTPSNLSNILEIGCGVGFYSYLINEKSSKINLTDLYNCADLQEFKKINKIISFSINNADKKLNYKNKSFDFVFSMDVIEHLKNDSNFIKECIRITKKNGFVLIGTPNLNRLGNILLKLAGKLKFPRKIGEDSYGDCIHQREYSINKIKSLMKKLNIFNYGIHPVGFRLPFFFIGNPIVKNLCQYLFVKIKVE